jgi:hypothetical protein
MQPVPAEVKARPEGELVMNALSAPYSPDLTPIEKAWAKLKQWLREAKARTKETLDHAITDGFTSHHPGQC